MEDWAVSLFHFTLQSFFRSENWRAYSPGSIFSWQSWHSRQASKVLKVSASSFAGGNSDACPGGCWEGPSEEDMKEQSFALLRSNIISKMALSSFVFLICCAQGCRDNGGSLPQDSPHCEM